MPVSLFTHLLAMPCLRRRNKTPSHVSRGLMHFNETSGISRDKCCCSKKHRYCFYLTRFCCVIVQRMDVCIHLQYSFLPILTISLFTYFLFIPKVSLVWQRHTAGHKRLTDHSSRARVSPLGSVLTQNDSCTVLPWRRYSRVGELKC